MLHLTKIIPLALLSTALAAVLRDDLPTSAPAREALERRQEGSITTVITTSIFPGGVSPGSTGQESTVPLACIDGCWLFSAQYVYCFLLSPPPFANGTTRTNTCGGICNQNYFNGLSACLNCIVANGGERDFGYSTNSSRTADPSLSASTSGSVARPADSSNPLGLIDLSQANGWLGNMTSYCAANATLTGASSVTAVPTTTGPYKTSWTSGETISRTVWTGLAQYSAPVATITRTIGPNSGPPSSTTPASGTSPASGTTPGSGSSAAASQSSRAAGLSEMQIPGSWAMGFGALLAWAAL